METQPVNAQPALPQPAEPQPALTNATPRACPRCQGRVLRRHRDTASHEIGLYSCRCGFLFKSPNPPQQPENTIDGNPDSDDYFTNFTEISYDPSEVALKKQTFLVAYQLGLTVEQAAQLAGVSARAAYYWRDKDHDFAQAWHTSRDRLVEALEMQAFQRAANGSDRMLTFLLKSHRPEIYNERVRANTPNSSTQDPDRTFSLAEIYEKVRKWEVDDKWEVLDPPQTPAQPEMPETQEQAHPSHQEDRSELPDPDPVAAAPPLVEESDYAIGLP